MSARTVRVRTLGAERRRVAIIDDCAPDPVVLREAAARAAWTPARAGYPGLRAPLPATYLAEVAPLIGQILADLFSVASARVLDASFSIVTADPASLTPEQRVPHVDATAPGRFAFVHYLVLGGCDGTAFFRHRATGYESIDDARAALYYPRLAAGASGAAAGYIADSTPVFERTGLVEGAYNRAVVYASAMLHSGAIAPGAALPACPRTGRLTVTGFLAAG